MRKRKITVHKSGPFNLLVDRAKSMVKLIIFVLSFVVKDEFPNSNVWVREESLLSNNLWSVLLKLFTEVYSIHYYIRDSRRKMNYRFNIIAMVTYKIYWVLETMFKFMLPKVT